MNEDQSEESSSIGAQKLPGYVYPSGVAYIVLPIDLTREEYIRTCMRTETVTILQEDGSVVHRVPVAEQCWDYIEFPLTNDTYGSPVVFVTDPIHKKPCIVATIQRLEKMGNRNSDQFKIIRKVGDGFVEVSGSARDKNINLLLSGISDGKINLHVFNDNDSGLISVQVQGKLDVITTKETAFTQYTEYKVVTVNKDDKDAFSDFVQTEKMQQLHSKRVEFRTQKEDKSPEPIAKADTLKKVLDDFFLEVSKATVTTMLGTMPLLNSAQIASYKERTQDILSKLSFTE